MKDSMSRRGFLSRAAMLLFASAAAALGTGERTRGDLKELEVKKTSRKRADHWRELAG
ncbi:MAG: hypothetical protein JXA64_04940 [Candidatus Fermentibacteraceae bacterium]|nr:hypothetical protein [Candidatus Fermentibacteraceae bacterium]MBN2608441.1 hypothetical protein [Candidatus Fermentibacteraceae bacterium]